jgi:arylformamidase
MKIYDISVTVTPSLPVWPGDPQIVLERVSKMEEGEHNNISRIAAGVHIGTHVDAPYHFIADGKTIEQLSLDALIGPAQVVELPGEVQLIGAKDLEAAGIAPGMKRLLLKTRNSRYWSQPTHEFHTDFVGVDASGADYLVSRGIRLVGIDYLSIAPYHHSKPTHEILLKASVVIVEGLDLSRAQPGEYTLYCLPVKLAGSDGAPARAVLVKA